MSSRCGLQSSCATLALTGWPVVEGSHIRWPGLSSSCGWLLRRGAAVGPTDQFRPYDATYLADTSLAKRASWLAKQGASMSNKAMRIATVWAVALNRLRYWSTVTSQFSSLAYLTTHPGHMKPKEIVSGASWIGGWLSPRTSLNDVKRREVSRPSR